MKKSKIFTLTIFTFIIIFTLTGCGNETTKVNKKDLNAPAKTKEITGKIYQAELDKDGNIVIDKNNITEDVSYYSYEYQGVIISILAVKDEKGDVHIVVNTCQSCGGSPYAYFIQAGNKIECQNCGNMFLISELDNLVSDGCHPIGIENINQKDGKYIIDHTEIEQYKNKFENWKGPKK